MPMQCTQIEESLSRRREWNTHEIMFMGTLKRHNTRAFTNTFCCTRSERLSNLRHEAWSRILNVWLPRLSYDVVRLDTRLRREELLENSEDNKAVNREIFFMIRIVADELVVEHQCQSIRASSDKSCCNIHSALYCTHSLFTSIHFNRLLTAMIQSLHTSSCTVHALKHRYVPVL